LVKRGIAAVLEAELAKPSWRGHPVMMSGVTDPYQRLERDERLTRACLELFVRYRNPVAIITRSPLILRDLDQTRVHFEVAVQSVGEQDAVRHLFGLSRVTSRGRLRSQTSPPGACPQRRP